MVKEFLYFAAVGTNAVLALILFLNNTHKKANKLLAIFSISLGVWLFASYLSDIVTDHALLWNKLVFVGPIIIPIALFLFIREIAGKENKYRILISIYGTVSVLLFLFLFFSHLFVEGVTPRIDNHGDLLGYNITRGPIYYVFVLYLASLLLIGLTLLIRAYHSSKGILKSQLRYVAIGSIASIVWALFFSVLLVNLTGSSEYSQYGAISSPIIIALYSFAIIRHQFLDIRMVVLRFVAYLISLLIIVLMLSVFAFFVTSIIFNRQQIPVEIGFYYVITSVAIAVSFGYIKKLVDSVTIRLFFRQHYSVDKALNEVSTYSTRSVETKSIQSHTIKIIEKTILPEYVGFVMFDQENVLSLEVSNGKYPTKELQLEGFLGELSKLRQKITTPNDVKETDRLKHYLELAHICVITRLSTSNKSIGFLIMGEKKNGSPYNSQDIQLLTLMANDLALALQNAKRYEEIQSFNTTLQNKINEATEALKRTNKKLVALDDAKDEFISMASHQLRTPLTSVKGYLSMLLDGDMGKVSKAQQQALKEAFSSSQRMVFLISDFLNVSRIRTGKFSLEPTSTNLCQIVKDEIAQLKDLVASRGQTLRFKPPSKFPLVMLDEHKTRQVMMNMIDNAIFYTPPGGTIEVILENKKGEIVFKVTDSGIGVPVRDQHRLFTKFFRASNARQARPDGTGLGLFMAQKVIMEQGGKIIFESVEGKGSTFGFCFPLEKITRH